MPRDPKIAFHPAKSNTANLVLQNLRGDPNFEVHPDQPVETKKFANYRCRSNGRVVAIEKTHESGVCAVVADDGRFHAFKHQSQRGFPKYDSKALNFAVNSNIMIEALADYPPIGFRFATTGSAMEFVAHVAALPRLA